MSKRTNAGKKVTGRHTPTKPGIASRYIDEADFGPEIPVVLIARASTTPQERNNSPQDQEGNLWQVADEGGSRIVGSFSHTGPGADPEWLAEAAAHARKLDARLFAESTDRFIRPHGFKPWKLPEAQATEADLKRLRQVCGGVRLMTHLHPDASPKDVHAYQENRGKQQKGRRGGRPRARKPGYKKVERLRRMTHVLEYLWVGNSRRTIAKLMNLHLTQIQRLVGQIREGTMRTHFLIKKKLFDLKSL